MSDRPESSAREPVSPPPSVPPDPETMSDFEDVERMTRAFVHWAKFALLIGLPFWLALLVLIPQLGLGLNASLLSSSVVAVAITVAAERVWVRRVAPASGDGAPSGAMSRRRARRPMSAARAVILTLVGVAVAAYVIFIVVTIVRGG